MRFRHSHDRIHVVTFAVVQVISIAVVSYGQTPNDVFTRGNEFYRKGQFQDALKQYESILQQGYVSPELYFNIGNSYYRLGKIAPAVLAYERANRLRPNDPDIHYNLKLVNLRTIDRIEPVPELFVFQWLRTVGGLVSNQTAIVLFTMSWGILFLSLAAIYLAKQPSIAEQIRWVMLTALLGSGVFGGMMGVHSWERNATRDQSVITSPVVTAKSSPDDQSVDAFVVHEGLKVRTSDRVGDWLKIVLPDGKVGWIHSRECEHI